MSAGTCRYVGPVFFSLASVSLISVDQAVGFAFRASRFVLRASRPPTKSRGIYLTQ